MIRRISGSCSWSRNMRRQLLEPSWQRFRPVYDKFDRGLTLHATRLPMLLFSYVQRSVFVLSQKDMGPSQNSSRRQDAGSPCIESHVSP